MPKLPHVKKVLVIGSGPIVIGQAAEFDYAGTQACLALKEEGIEVVLVNNNPATIMTDQNIADKVYLEPLTCESLDKIIEKERPDGLLPTLGGQTGLNLAVSLTEAGVLEKYSVELLGTPLDGIQKGEDREMFKAMMKQIGEPVPESISTSKVEEAQRFASSVGYPIIVRPAYTLGGAGGGIAANEEELLRIVKNGLHASPIHQVLVEQSVKGWKEVEYEVMRDDNDTCIIVCNMENIDPVGVHTGDSIVVAPSQTLNDRQYQMLRTVSCKVIRELGVVGGCNIQLALHPESDEFVIIEVNPRVSRSSALASKATGYPIARIAAKLALGYHLDEVLNPITGDTYASFEPAIDYIAVKIPRWPYDKFSSADRLLGTQMKATGEVMALARNFPAALNKAIRSLEIGIEHFHLPAMAELTEEELSEELEYATDNRLFAVAESLRRGYSVDWIHNITGITTYFLYEMEAIITMEKQLEGKSWEDLSMETVLQAKLFGFSDPALAALTGADIEEIRNRQEKEQIIPSYKMVDTCAAEFSAETPYFYSSWNEFDEVDALEGKKRVVVLGSGPIRIGQGVEFDYCSVHAAMSLREQNIDAIVVNNNPETVSTDFNTADHLYFEPLTEEDVLHVMKKEQADGVLVQFGGQTAINLSDGLEKAGMNIMGTSLASIEAAEDRDKFYRMLQKLGVPHIPGETVMGFEDAKETAAEIGYPVLIRPSYVIGGRGMVVVQDETQLAGYLEKLEKDSQGTRIFPLLIDRFIHGYEAEIDVVCDGEDVLIPGIFQHVERAGVHSGDSIAVFPGPDFDKDTRLKIEQYTKLISSELQVKGIMNIQFVLSEDKRDLYVLEVNPRASRTVPIASKVTGVPLIDLATKVQMGIPLKGQEWKLGLHEPVPYYAVKMPVFSTTKLPGVDPLLGPEMKSTGEAIGLGRTLETAMRKAFGWNENSAGTLRSEEPVYLEMNDLEKASGLIASLRETKIPVHASPETTELLEKAGVTVEETVTLEKAADYCLDNKFSLICSTTHPEENQQAKTLREAALLSDTLCMTAAETLTAFLQSVPVNDGKPETIGELLESAKDVNKEKERV